jgi:hypothetical protein
MLTSSDPFTIRAVKTSSSIRHFPESYVIKLQKLLVAMQRQDELSGRASEGVQLATDLAALRR